MTRSWRIARNAAIGVGGLVLLAALVLFVIADTSWGNERVRGFAVARVNAGITGTLTIGKLRGNLFSNATLTDVRLTDSAKHPIFTARRAELHYAFWPALHRQLVLRSAVLDTAVVTLDRQPGAKWNFQTLTRPKTSTGGSSGAKPELGDITLHHSRFYYRRPWTPDSTLSAHARDSAIAKALAPDARRRVERVPGGFQRVLDYHDIDAHLGSVRIGDSVTPTRVDIAKLSMLAEPYRPPVIDIRNLTGVLLASKDSLWWRGAHMVMPGSNVSGDGTIGFHKSGFMLALRGAPVAIADLRWLDPKLPSRGGGAVQYGMRLKGDTAEFSIDGADLRLDTAHVTGRAHVAFVAPKGGKRRLASHDVDLTLASLGTSLIHEIAPSLALRRTGSLDGHLVARGGAETSDIKADLHFNDIAAGRSHVTADGGLAFGNGVATRGLDVRLMPLRLTSVAGFAPRAKLSGVASGTVVVTGSQRGGWTARGDIAHTDRTGNSRISGSGQYLLRDKRFVADVTLHPLSLATVDRYVPSARLRGSVSGALHARGTLKDFQASGRLHSSSGGTIDIDGSASIAGAGTHYDFASTLDAFNANAITGKVPATSLSGRVSAKGVGKTLATADAVIRADLTKSRFDTFAVDRIILDAHVKDGLSTIAKGIVQASGLVADVTGNFGLVDSKSGKLAFTISTDSLGVLRKWIGSSDTSTAGPSTLRQSRSLAAARADSVKRADAVRIERIALGLPEGVDLHVDTIPGIRRDSLGGWLTAYGWVTGNLNTIGVDAILRGKDVVAHGYSVGVLSASAKSVNVRNRALPIDYSLSADTVQAFGRRFETVASKGTWTNGALAANLFIRQDSAVQLAALGRFTRDSAKTSIIALDSLRAVFDTVAWRLVRPARVQVASGSWMVDSLDLRSSYGGRLFANGTVRASVNLDLAIEKVDVASALRAVEIGMDASGTLNATAHATGTRENPVIAGTSMLRDAAYKGTRAPDVDAEFSYRNRELVASALARDSTGHAVLDATGSAPMNLALEAVTGSRLLPGPIVADVRMDSLQLATLPFETRALEEYHGKVAGSAQVRGTWKAPLYAAQLALRNGGLRMPVSSTGMQIDRALADVRIVHDSVIVDSLVAFAKGEMRAWGVLDYSHPAHPGLSFTASGNDLRVFDSPRGQVDANVELTGAGPLDEIRVTGRGEMLHGYLALKQFRKDLLRVKAPGDITFFSVFDTSAVPGDSLRVALDRAQHRRIAIVADLSLVVDRGNYYRNRPDANTEFFTGEGEVITAHIDQRSSDQWAVGFARIGDGGIAIFRTRGFVPARGAMTFGPHTNAPGMVQQIGERIVYDAGRGLFPLELFTGGSSLGPAVGLESGTLFPMRGRELNGYLTVGRSSLSLLQQSGSSLSGSEEISGQLSGETGALARRQQGATAIGVVLHDIGTGATKEFALDAFSISPADVPTELVFGKSGGVRGALAEGGRYITPNLLVAGQVRLFTRGLPGIRLSQKFGTTYRLDAGVEPRFLFRNPDDLGITHPTERTSAFGAFLTRMWDFK